MPPVHVREIEIAADGVRLSGAVWTPERRAVPAGVVLVGGSGPADRNNGGYFDAIRDRLVDQGLAVLAWDKRGVGRSTGTWASAGVEVLARDLAAAVTALRSTPGVDPTRVGVFGHSEGGWVALRACATDVTARCVIVNSCPAVSFVEAEVHALTFAGVAAEVSRRLFNRLRSAGRDGIGLIAAREILADVSDPALGRALDHAGFRLTDESWAQLAAWIDYSPRGDLERIHVPLLAIYGAEDPLVPVDASRMVLERVTPAARLEVFAGADHRLCREGCLAPGYLDLVADWYAQNL
jgi:pimeloyl-ACP methyl ester carboxylesterase